MTELKRCQMLIDGHWVDAEDGRTFESINPATAEPWALIPEATALDVNRAVLAAHRAFTEGEWANALPTARGKYLRRLADLLAERSEELGRAETIDTGKMLKETRWQAKYIAEFFHYYAGCADKIQGATLPIDKPDMHAFTMREPLGVVAAVVPWNSQLFLVAVKIGPALAAGNTVVLKASEHASVPMLEFGKLIEEAGFPPGVVNIVTGHGDPCGKALTSHPLVQRISFTGGPASARNVIHNSASNFAQLSLELGGKSPFIVFEDADVESAVNGSISGIFGASGQSCVAGSRLYLHEKIADAFLDKMTAQVRNIRIGDPLAEETQMGPLATKEQLSRIAIEVAHAQEQGGKLLTGGNRPASPNRGWYYEPTIVECPDQKMRIVDTELFGPVLSVLRFKSEDDVVRLANDTRYGLAAGIFTRNGARALRVTRAIRAGIVWVNTYRVVSPIAEFGGFKESGYGRESGLQAVYDYTRPKTVWINTSDKPLSNPFVMR
ncbi:aldehyde dehydrogenase [Hypericibacter sp.]|uniref:aldehyde dehydrogenase n=1 Tax=Hypericibacter sp. TaxID=2705401 RepID=UPI003D6CE308